MATKFNIKGNASLKMQGQSPSLQQLQEITERVAKNKFAQQAQDLKTQIETKYNLPDSLQVTETNSGFQIAPKSDEIAQEMRLKEFGNEEKSAKPVWRSAMQVQKVHAKPLANEIKQGILKELK